MKTCFVVVAATLVALALSACHESRRESSDQRPQVAPAEAPTEFEAPTDLKGAFDRLDHTLSPAQRAQLLDAPTEKGAVALAHHGLGTWMRNEWGLWSGEGPLHDYFAELGLWHAEDMSGVILASYWRYHHGLPLEVDRQVVDYLEYWANTPEPANAGALHTLQNQRMPPNALRAGGEPDAPDGSQ